MKKDVSLDRLVPPKKTRTCDICKKEFTWVEGESFWYGSHATKTRPYCENVMLVVCSNKCKQDSGLEDDFIDEE
jgi:hypothetical protein